MPRIELADPWAGVYTISTDGAAAMRELELIRRDLERELEQIRAIGGE